MIYLASKALVSLVNDAQWDVDRIRPSVFSFIDTDAVLYEDHGPGSMATLPCCDRTVSDLLQVLCVSRTCLLTSGTSKCLRHW